MRQWRDRAVLRVLSTGRGGSGTTSRRAGVPAQRFWFCARVRPLSMRSSARVLPVCLLLFKQLEKVKYASYRVSFA